MTAPAAGPAAGAPDAGGAAAAREARLDRAIALFTVAYGLLNSFEGVRRGLLPTTYPTAGVLLTLAVGALLLVRRRYVVPVALAVFAADLFRADPVAVAVAAFTLAGGEREGSRPPPSRILLLLLGAAAHTVSQATSEQPVPVARALVYSAGVVGGGALAGLYLGTREQLARRRAAEHRMAADRTRAEERRRIAWEMHDVVTHRVVQIVLDADVLALQLRAADPAGASEAGRIAATGRQALEELRATLGVLRRGDTPVAPQPTLADLPALLAGGPAGAGAVLRAGPGLDAVPATVQRTAYRVVQEALTNARKHAPGAPVTVSVALAGPLLRVHVGNGPPRGPGPAGLPSGGHGLIGMAERVRLAGGTLTAADRADGAGFDVRAELPVDGGRGGPA
ncbi:histidine kinase [Streptomyces sp. NPDC089919]|uniref:sensor histidine kinase n=1 Tax=Streptomyces sp. NPDC089919 TaxID=3155188 RepID=UPI003433EF3F